ncbi:unnamed protein product [Prorocentrum cordatum]|uniref:RING-type E3 ubiquitin transferase n=1 Tax=Prorocentrum cordatum TaxID=2364126 RepID=A0ABN9SNK4_9DINO|nr:unnamed protein product [Polarella glacialis]
MLGQVDGGVSEGQLCVACHWPDLHAPAACLDVALCIWLESQEAPASALEQQRQLRVQRQLLSQLQERTAEQRAQGAEGRAPLGLRPAAQPELRRAQVVQNPLHLHGKSLRLAFEPGAIAPAAVAEGGHPPEGQGNETPAAEPEWHLAFTFDATVQCEVLVHTCLEDASLDSAPLVAAAWTSHPRERAGRGLAVTWTDGALPTQPRLYAEPGLGLRHQCPVELGGFRPQRAHPGELCTSALCVELRTAGAAAAEGVAAQWTLVGLVHRAADAGTPGAAATLAALPPAVVCEVRAQRVQLPVAGLASNYDVHEVFGGPQSAQSPQHGAASTDCVICMSEPRDTVVLPCRHMCLCGGCADAMRSRVQYRSYRCPICRERVSCLEQAQRSQPDASYAEGYHPHRRAHAAHVASYGRYDRARPDGSQDGKNGRSALLAEAAVCQGPEVARQVTRRGAEREAAAGSAADDAAGGVARAALRRKRNRRRPTALHVFDPQRKFEVYPEERVVGEKDPRCMRCGHDGQHAEASFPRAAESHHAGVPVHGAPWCVQETSGMDSNIQMCGGDDSGDGAGILTQIPWEMLAAEVALPEDRSGVAVGMLFLTKDTEARARLKERFELKLEHEGFHILGYRQVPVDKSVLGKASAESEPWIEQIVVQHPDARGDELELKLYLARRNAEIGEERGLQGKPDEGAGQTRPKMRRRLADAKPLPRGAQEPVDEEAGGAAANLPPATSAAAARGAASELRGEPDKGAGQTRPKMRRLADAKPLPPGADQEPADEEAGDAAASLPPATSAAATRGAASTKPKKMRRLADAKPLPPGAQLQGEPDGAAASAAAAAAAGAQAASSGSAPPPPAAPPAPAARQSAPPPPLLRRRPCAFVNARQSCYMNSLLQALFPLVPVRRAVQTALGALGPAPEEGLAELFYRGNKLVGAAIAAHNPIRAIVPNLFMDRHRDRQEDAREFLQLNLLQNDGPLLADLCRGRDAPPLSCPTCPTSRNSSGAEPFALLSLPLVGAGGLLTFLSVRAALAACLDDPFPVQVDDWQCECSGLALRRAEVLKTHRIADFPEILLINLSCAGSRRSTWSRARSRPTTSSRCVALGDEVAFFLNGQGASAGEKIYLAFYERAERAAARPAQGRPAWWVYPGLADGENGVRRGRRARPTGCRSPRRRRGPRVQAPQDPSPDPRIGRNVALGQQPVVLEFTIGPDFKSIMMEIQKAFSKRLADSVSTKIIIDQQCKGCSRFVLRVGRGVVLWDKPSMMAHRDNPFETFESSRNFVMETIKERMPTLLRATRKPP